MRRRAAREPELLDAAHHDRAELEQSLDQVAEVNRMLGGTRAVLRTLDEVISPVRSVADHTVRTAAGSRQWTILDVGTGSADIPIAIAAWAARQTLDVSITATDVHPQMRAIARDRTRREPSIAVEAADALALPFAGASFDIVLLSLTLHHFDRPDQIRALREAARVARSAVIVNELERCLTNYIGAQLLAATRWRSNRLTRHDGPLSVAQAFTAGELLDIARAAGLQNARVRRVYFRRLVVVGYPAVPASTNGL